MRTMNALLAFPRLLPLAICLATACTSHEGKEPETETPVVKSVQLRATIASVQLAQDCPDAPAAQPAAQEPARSAPATPPVGDVERETSGRMAAGAAIPGSGSGWSPPCEQSTMQITLSHDGKDALPIEIKAVRLTAAGQGGVLATVPQRGPSKWSDAGVYEPWDQQLAPTTELKTSYKLGEPDWGLVAKTLGSNDTFGKRYVLEVDIAFAGRSITVRSPEFERERPHVIVT